MTTVAWLRWSALSIAVAVLTVLGLAFVMPNLEAALLAFAAGMAWSASTPWLLRRLR